MSNVIQYYGNVKRAVIAATTGDNAIVAAVTNKKIRVLAAFGTADAAGTVRWESGAGGTALTGQSSVGIDGGYVLPLNDAGWFETAAGAALSLEVTTTGAFDGCVVYVEL